MGDDVAGARARHKDVVGPDTAGTPDQYGSPMTPYVGRVAIGTAEFAVSIDDLDAFEWSAEVGEVQSIPGVTSGVFTVRLLDGPRADERASAALESVLPSGMTYVVGAGPFALP